MAYSTLAIANTAKMPMLKMASTTEKTRRLIKENNTLSDDPVRKDSIRWWSFMRCNISPVCLLSKKLTGSFISLIKKSVRMEILILVLMCSSIHPRTNSIANLPVNKANCASNTIYTK